MSDITVKLPIPAGSDAFFAKRNMMVTPVNESEASQLATSLEAIARVTRTNWKALSTLKQMVETKGASMADIAKTLDMLMEPNELASDQIETVRVLLGRSALVCRQSPDDDADGRILQ